MEAETVGQEWGEFDMGTGLHSVALLASVAIGLGAAASASADPVLVNGSFEQPAEAPNSLTEITYSGIPGWTGDSIGGNAHEYIINGNIQDLSGSFYGTTPFGDQYLGLNAIYRNSFRSIESQVVSGFTVGEQYELTVYWANLDGATDSKVSVVASDGGDGSGDILADGEFTGTTEGPYGFGTIDFEPVTIDFTAISDTITFSIGNQSRTGVEGIDNVSLTSLAPQAGVPEPATWAMLISGFGLVGGSLRRSRRAQAIA